MTHGRNITLELDDIQAGVLHPRPSPYVASYLLIRIDDRRDGREMLRRAPKVVAAGGDRLTAESDAWVNLAFTFEGLKFPPEFQQGMAARAEILGDVGESAPANWEPPLGAPEVHVAIAAIAPDAPRLEVLLERARAGYRGLSGLAVIYRQDCAQLPNQRTSLGYKDGIAQPLIEGTGIDGLPGQGPAIKPGEFILGYPR